MLAYRDGYFSADPPWPAVISDFQWCVHGIRLRLIVLYGYCSGEFDSLTVD
jgi:hypothetical protein